MRNCFACLRRVKFYFRSKKEDKKWLNFTSNYCSHNSKFHWCQLILQHLDQLQNFTNASDQTLRQLKQTNISSQIIKVMRRDYQKKQTPFPLFVDIFTQYCIHKYGDTLTSNNSQHVLSKMSADMENFVDFVRSVMVVFYMLEEREVIGDDRFFRVTLAGFVGECVFLREEFYDCVLQVTKLVCKEAQDRISFNMQKYHNLPIQSYDIHPKYTLTSSTLNHFSVPQPPQPLPVPYLSPTKLTKQILKSRTPAQKTKCTQSLLHQIQFCIKKFYSDHKINQNLYLDPDNALAILLYVLVQSQQTQLLVHVVVVEQFLGKDMLEGRLGVGVEALKGALMVLEKGGIGRGRGVSLEEYGASLWVNTRSYFQHISHN